MRTYEQINAGFNRQMLGGQRDRVKFLRRILTRLGNPDQRFKIIHIAGTNGKGSTGTMLEQGLQNAVKQISLALPGLFYKEKLIGAQLGLLIYLDTISSVQFSCSVMSNSLRPHELQHARPPCPSPTPGVHSNSSPSSR